MLLLKSFCQDWLRCSYPERIQANTGVSDRTRWPLGKITPITKPWSWTNRLSRNRWPLHAATDDRCANFSASTCPTQQLPLQQTLSASKLPLEKFHRLLDLAFGVNFWSWILYHTLYFFSPSLDCLSYPAVALLSPGSGNETILTSLSHLQLLAQEMELSWSWVRVHLIFSYKFRTRRYLSGIIIPDFIPLAVQKF